MSRLLLDTHALIWVVAGGALRPEAHDAVLAALVDGQVYLSAVNAWEIGLLTTRKPDRGGLVLLPDGPTWFEQATIQTRAIVLPLTPDVAMEASHLPDWDHRDPADRFLVATARALGLTLVTRDRAILAYAEAGHVKALAC